MNPGKVLACAILWILKVQAISWRKVMFDPAICRVAVRS